MNWSDRDIEQKTGLPAEAVRQIVQASLAQTEALLKKAIEQMQKQVREVQEVVGPHGSVSRLQAGGVRVAREGVKVFADGVTKTTIEADGDFLAGSDITDPSTTSFIVFVNEQAYNTEFMEAGDILIGDNSTGVSNVKFDASEGQLQFRYGQSVQLYMDTDGSFKAASGAIEINSTGIIFDNSAGALYFKDSGGSISSGTIVWGAGGNNFTVDNRHPGGGHEFSVAVALPNIETMYMSFKENPSIAKNLRLYLDGGTAGSSIVMGTSNVIYANTPGHVVTQFNGTLDDTDFRVSGDNELDLFYIDASADRVGVGTNAPGAKLDVRGGAIFNEAGADVDFRIEGDTDANLFFLDASTDRVGIGTNTPSAKLNVEGHAVFNDLGADMDFRIEGDTNANLFFLDASVDAIGIGTNTPDTNALLDIAGGIKVDSIVNDTGLAADTYTPTLTNTTNIAASTAHVTLYERIGNHVHVSGVVEVDATTAGVACVMKVSLPVASDFTATEDASGVFVDGTNGVAGAIIPDTTNNVLDFRWTPSVNTNAFYRFEATYVVK